MNGPEKRGDAPEHQRRVRAWETPDGVAWIIGAGALVLVILALAFGVRSLGDNEKPVEPSQAPSPIVGGMLLPGDAADSPLLPTAAPQTTERQTTAPPTATEGETPERTPLPLWEAGRIAVAAADRVTLHADANPDSPLLDAYAAGASFVVMEPSGDYESYPVPYGDSAWVRLRAEDGLVGWADIADLWLEP